MSPQDGGTGEGRAGEAWPSPHLRGYGDEGYDVVEDNPSCGWVEDVMNWSQTIYGEPASKANRRIPTKRGAFIKSKKALEYEKTFAKQVRPPKTPIKGPVEAFIEIAYSSWRSDLDESLILDLLQKHGIYGNDRQIVKRQVLRYPCTDKPYAYIQVSTVSFNGETPKSWRE